MNTGIFRDMTSAEYHALDIPGSTILRKMRRSPMHARYAMLHPRETTPALILGEATHCAILEPERFRERYAQPPKVDKRTNAGKAEWAGWVAAHPNVVALSADEYTACLAMRSAVESHPIAASLLTGQGMNEATVIVDLPAGRVRVRPDRVTAGRVDPFNGWTVLVDVKTARNASAEAFAKAIAEHGYHIQAALYLDALSALSPLQRRFVFVVVENEAPYPTAVYELTDEAIEQGRGEYRSALVQFYRCMESGIWPGYPQDASYIDLPRWARVDDIREAE